MNQEYQLQFISREDLKKHLKEVYNSYQKIFASQSLDNFNRNIVDPFQILIEHVLLGKDIKKIISGEIIRQQNKSCANVLGYFHQYIFRYLNPDWETPERGWDLVNNKQLIYVEIKTKHNTMNSSSSQRTYQRMEQEIKQNPQAQCYLVEIIAKKTQDKPWKPNFGGMKTETNERIRKISIDKFYEIITGDKQAFFKLVVSLPPLLKEIVAEEGIIQTGENTVLTELEKQNPNHLLALFNLSFQQYEGFKEFLEDNKEMFTD
jgi:Eco47II restriction endonuclease